MKKTIIFLYLLHCVLGALVWTSLEYIDVTENVTVYWTDVDLPNNATDTIGVFLSNGLKIYSKNVKESPSYMTGMGSMNITALNMRHSFIFKYLRGNTVVAESNPVLVNTTKPMHGHLSLTENSNEIRISWTSNSSSTPMVMFGTVSGNYNLNQIGNSSTYQKNDLCGFDSKYYYISPGFIHTVIMSDLTPNTVYYYRFGSNEGWSEEFNFVSPQANNSTGVNILAFGDSGVSKCYSNGRWCMNSVASLTRNMLSDMDTLRYDMLMHIGDISYATGFSARWEEFMYEIEPLATRVPYMVGVGNHELEDSFGECGVPYRKRFMMPNNPKYWYTIDYPLVRIIVMSTEHNYTEGSEQYEWLENELASIDHKSKWTIFFGHKPAYTSSKYPGNIVASNLLKSSIEPLLVNYSVDVALWGHMHTYERTCPVNNGKCDGDYIKPNAPIHFVIGTGGAGSFYGYEKRNWSLFQSSTHGHLRIHIPSRQSMQLQFVDSGSYKVIDEVTIYNGIILSSNSTENNTTAEITSPSTSGGTTTGAETTNSGSGTGTTGTGGAVPSTKPGDTQVNGSSKLFYNFTVLLLILAFCL